jgi:hypothetical protein
MAERQLNTLPPPVEFAAQRRGSVYQTYPARQPTELEQVDQRWISLGDFLQLKYRPRRLAGLVSIGAASSTRSISGLAKPDALNQGAPFDSAFDQ